MSLADCHGDRRPPHNPTTYRNLEIAVLIGLVALLTVLGWSSPAHAEPVTIALFGAAFAATLPGLAVTAAINIGVSLAFSGLAYLLTGGGQRQTTDANNDPQAAVRLPERSGLLERKVLYGTRTVSGGVFFQNTVADAGSDGPDVYVLGFAIADGECDALEAVIINGVECLFDINGIPQTAPWNDGFGNTYLKASFRSGSTTQAIDPIIAARFPAKSSEYRQRGVCTAVVEMKFGNDADHHTELWGAGGIPDLLFRVRGKKIYDPRDANQNASTPSTWQWSENASLIEADYLMSEIGFSVDPAEIDWASVRDSADIDDELVATLGGQESRGRINGIVLASEANDSVLGAMQQCNRALIRRANGVYKIRSDRASEPVATIHQGMIVGDYTFQNETDTRSALNTVVLQFAPAEHDNQNGETTYRDAALVATDGQEYEARVSLRFVDTPATAQRLGFALVTENRQSRTFTGVFDIGILIPAGKPAGEMLEVGDVVRIWFEDDYDAINGLYTVTSVEISSEMTIGLSLVGYTPDVIDGWSVDLEVPYEEAA